MNAQLILPWRWGPKKKRTFAKRIQGVSSALMSRGMPLQVVPGWVGGDPEDWDKQIEPKITIPGIQGAPEGIYTLRAALTLRAAKPGNINKQRISSAGTTGLGSSSFSPLRREGRVTQSQMDGPSLNKESTLSSAVSSRSESAQSQSGPAWAQHSRFAALPALNRSALAVTGQSSPVKSKSLEEQIATAEWTGHAQEQKDHSGAVAAAPLDTASVADAVAEFEETASSDRSRPTDDLDEMTRATANGRSRSASLNDTALTAITEVNPPYVPRSRVKLARLEMMRRLPADGSSSDDDRRKQDDTRDLTATLSSEWQFMINSDEAVYLKPEPRAGVLETAELETFYSSTLKFTSSPSCFAFRRVQKSSDFISASGTPNRTTDSAAEQTPTAVEPLSFDPFSSDGVIAFGFATGDILVYDTTKKRSVVQLNRDRRIQSGTVSALAWVPNFGAPTHGPTLMPQETLLLVAIGTQRSQLYLFDVSKPDGEFDGPMLTDIGAVRVDANKRQSSRAAFDDGFKPETQTDSANPLLRIQVCSTQVSDLAFCHSGKILAVSSLAGRIFMLDWRLCLSPLTGRDRFVDARCVVAICDSYFGAVHSICWSPCDRLFVSGGEDDAVSVWAIDFVYDRNDCSATYAAPSSPNHRTFRIDVTALALGEGHRNFISRVKFDPFAPSLHRVVSVGQDGAVALWDLGHVLIAHDARRRRSMLRRSRSHSRGHEDSVLSSQQIDSFEHVGAFTLITDSTSTTAGDEEAIVVNLQRQYPVACYASFAAVFRQLGCRTLANIDPVAILRTAHSEPAFDVNFTESCIITVCAGSVVKFWARPE